MITTAGADPNRLEPVITALTNRNVVWSVLSMFIFLWCEAGASTFLTTQFVRHDLSNSQAALIAGASGLTGWIGQAVRARGPTGPAGSSRCGS